MELEGWIRPGSEIQSEIMEATTSFKDSISETWFPTPDFVFNNLTTGHFLIEAKILSRMSRMGEFIEYFPNFQKIFASFVHSRNSRLKMSGSEFTYSK